MSYAVLASYMSKPVAGPGILELVAFDPRLFDSAYLPHAGSRRCGKKKILGMSAR